MLQDRPLSPPLGAAADLGSADQHVAGRSSLKTEERFPGGGDFVGCLAKPGRNAESPQGLDQAAMNGLVKFVAAGGQRMAARQDDTVGQLRIVQDRPAAGQPSYGGTRQTGRMFLAIGVGLEVAQREGGLAPKV